MNKLTCDLRAAVEDFFARCNFPCRVGGLSDDFFYDPDTEEVYYSPLVVEERDKVFYDNFNEGLSFPVSLFMVSLLHEVGHYYTEHMITKRDWRKYYLFNKFSSILPRRVRQKVYYNLRVEQLATLWAKMTALNMQEEIADAEKIFFNIFKDFKERNGL